MAALPDPARRPASRVLDGELVELEPYRQQRREEARQASIARARAKACPPDVAAAWAEDYPAAPGARPIAPTPHGCRGCTDVPGSLRAKCVSCPTPRAKKGTSRTFDYEEAQRMSAEGMTQREIADALGVDKSSIYRALRPIALDV